MPTGKQTVEQIQAIFAQGELSAEVRKSVVQSLEELVIAENRTEVGAGFQPVSDLVRRSAEQGLSPLSEAELEQVAGDRALRQQIANQVHQCIDTRNAAHAWHAAFGRLGKERLENLESASGRHRLRRLDQKFGFGRSQEL